MNQNTHPLLFAPPNNPFTHPVPLFPVGHRWVISDIHGCSQSFHDLLHRIQLKREDQLFLLGDYIDKGPDSKGVLERVLDLIEQGYQVFALRGNHEENFLRVVDDKRLLYQYAKEQHCEDLINPLGKVPRKYIKFMQGLPYYYELKDCFLVHAGFDFAYKHPFEDLDGMLNIRDYPAAPERIGHKAIIHGHNPKSLTSILDALTKQAPILPLDNGCVYARHKSKEGQGKLLCLNLDTKVLIMQENSEKASKLNR